MARFAIETVFKAIDRITAPVTKMETRVGKFARVTDRHLKSVNAVTTGLIKGLDGVGKAAAAGFAAVVTGAAALTAINRATTETDSLARAVGSTGLRVEALAGSLKGAGFQTDDVIDLFEEMNNKLGESAGLEEIAPVTESLAILGLEFEKIRDLSPEQQFTAIADAALAMEDGQKAAAAADILFGSNANKLIGILRQQGATIEDIIAAQSRYQFKTQQAVEGAAAWTKATGGTTKLLGSMAGQISGLLGEQLSPLVAALNETAIANKEVIQSGITEFVQGLADAVRWVIVNFESIVLWMTRIGKVLGIWFAYNAIVAAVAVTTAIYNGLLGIATTAVTAYTAAVAFGSKALRAAQIAMVLFQYSSDSQPYRAGDCVGRWSWTRSYNTAR